MGISTLTHTLKPAALAAAFILLTGAAAAGPSSSNRAAAQRRARATRTARPAAAQKTTAKPSAAHAYVCPMHPAVTSASPGRCPKCKMALVKRDDAGADADASPATPAAPQAGAAAESKVDAPRIPDVAVLDQSGRRLNFYTDLVRGRTVAINFIFTTCTTVCPPLTATFRRVQQTLGERAGRDVSLISVSVDPATDTPERLKGYAEKFKAGPGWTFVTGSKPEIDTLLKALGAATADRNDHTPMILVGNDAAGRWTRTYGLAPPATLVKVIDETAAAPAARATPAPAAATPDGVPSASEASAKYFPNNTLLTQDGRAVRFYDDMLKGKVVLINFMFTTCTGVCSPMTANLAKVQSHLGERVGKDVFMISLTVDPTVDTPDALRAFAAKHKAGPGWHFLTGKKEDVDWVLYKLGGYTPDKAAHSGVLLIGNEATSEWVKTAAMRNPAEIAGAVIELAGKGAERPK